MKRHVKSLIALVLLAALLPASLLLAGAALPKYYGETYYAQLSPMVERLKQTEGPKLVVVGGSSVAFGLDGALLEELLAEKGFSYTVCPFGLYAAVGTSAMLDLSRPLLRAGDVVVLAFEPVSEALSPYFGAAAYWKCAESDLSLLSGLDGAKAAALAGGYVPYLQERYAIRQSGTPPAAEGVYAKSSFDQRCDLVYPRQGSAMPLGYDTAQPVDLASVSIDPVFAGQVNDYIAAASRAGASVWLSFAPVNALALTDPSEAAVEAYFTLCSETFRCPVISDPNRYILDSGWFYDTNFHLNTAGAELRTVRLAEDLLAQLGCYRAVEHPLPAMPPSIAPPPQEEAGSDERCFTYAPVERGGETLGWLVSGVTAEGAVRTALTVPAAHEGKNVVGFADGALDGCAALESLTLPASIESLPDGIFRNCPGLRRLVLLHTDSLCAVTAHTFDGADRLRVYVPEAALPLYRDGAGCQANPWEQYRDRVHAYTAS